MTSFWFFLLLSFTGLHDFHVSRMTMDFNPDEQALEVSMHIFTDDLELGLEAMGHPGILLNTPKELSNADSLIQIYLERHLKLTHENGTKASLRWLGKESSEDYQATWIYFYLDLPSNTGAYTLKQDILTEVYDDQQNIVNLRAVKNPSLSLLTGDQPYFKFELP